MRDVTEHVGRATYPSVAVFRLNVAHHQKSVGGLNTFYKRHDIFNQEIRPIAFVPFFYIFYMEHHCWLSADIKIETIISDDQTLKLKYSSISLSCVSASLLTSQDGNFGCANHPGI